MDWKNWQLGTDGVFNHFFNLPAVGREYALFELIKIAVIQFWKKAKCVTTANFW